jgi:hypothetical protein
MFNINLKLGVYWSFLLIFDTASHKTNGSSQNGMKNKIDGQKRSSIFWLAKREVQVFLMAKREFPLDYSLLSLAGWFVGLFEMERTWGRDGWKT